MIKLVNGNILDAKEDIICHQVNCRGVMGSGLARQIKDKYPEVFKEYKKILDSHGNQLGNAQFVYCHDGKYIVNLFGQDKYGTNKQHTDYIALKRSFYEMLLMAQGLNLTIAIPYGIGCGLGGGDWNIVYGIIEEVFSKYNATIYKL